MKNQKSKKLLYSVGLLFSSIYSISKFAKYFDFDKMKNDIKNQKNDENNFDDVNKRILQEIKNISELRYKEPKVVDKNVTDNFNEYVEDISLPVYEDYLKDLSNKDKLDEYIKKERQKKEEQLKEKEIAKHEEAFKNFETTYTLDNFSDEEIKLLQKIWYEDNKDNKYNQNLIKQPDIDKEEARAKINQIFKLGPSNHTKEIDFESMKISIEDVLKTSNFSDNNILENDDNSLDNLVSNVLSKDGYVNLKELAFKTPEEALIQLFKALREENIINALQCFSTTSFVDNIDFLKNITANEWSFLPSEYDFFYKTNWIQLINQKASYILSFITNLLLEENQLITGLGKHKIDITEKDAFDIFKSLDTSKLNSLNIKSIDVPNPALMNINETKKVLINEAILDGALDKTERVVLFEYNGNTYFSCFTLIKYQEGWKVERFGAKFSLNTPLDFNSAYRVNNQEYYALTI